MTKQAKTRAMQKEYGVKEGKLCSGCCNCHQSSSLSVCIAFDETETWDPYSKACGLYNIPFLGLDPKKPTITELIAKRKEKEPALEGQLSFLEK